MNDSKNVNNNKYLFPIIMIAIALTAALAISYSFFQYNRTGGNNGITTAKLDFQFTDTNTINIAKDYPMSYQDADANHTSTFTIKAASNLTNGLRYKVYAIRDEDIEGKDRLLDSVISMKFTPAADADGYTTMINNYETAKSPVFINGKALISTGIVRNADFTKAAKSYSLSLWIDSSKIFVSSTLKRAINAEGNPSLADTTGSKIDNIGRYIKNNSTLVPTTLYPADSEQEGKIVYTTNELKNSYYNIKIVVESEEVRENNELVYFDANGGTVNTETMNVSVGSNYPNLPTPTRAGYTFLGWNGKNLFNKDNILDGYIDNNNGNSIAATNSYSTDYIDIKFNNNYTIQPKLSSGNWGAFYDENKSYISGFVYYDVQTVTSPTNAKYIKFTINYVNSNPNYSTTTQIEEGTEATAYEPYFVDNTVTVTQEKDHVLKAIWQKNS